MLLALAAGAVALRRPSPDPVKPGVSALVNGVSSHTFSPTFFCLFYYAPICRLLLTLFLSAAPGVARDSQTRPRPWPPVASQ